MIKIIMIQINIVQYINADLKREGRVKIVVRVERYYKGGSDFTRQVLEGEKVKIGKICARESKERPKMYKGVGC